MVRTVVAVLVLALAWMLWWAVGHTAYRKGLEAWIAERRAGGWTADVGDLATRGFPNRFDTTLTDVVLGDPATGIGWSAPFVQILSLAYKPHQAILLLPPEHELTLPGSRVAIAQARAESSVFLDPTPALALDRARVVIRDLTAVSSEGWDLALGEARFAAEYRPATGASYRIGAEILGMQLPAPARNTVDPAGRLPGTVDRMALDADVDFSAPWDRAALVAPPPRIVRIALTNAAIRWGDLELRAEGTIAIDASGLPEGRVTLQSSEWQTLLAMAEDVGLADGVAGAKGSEALDLLGSAALGIGVPLVFANGEIRLGPVLIGPAPRLALP